MLLRASGERGEADLDMKVVMGQSEDADGGIPNGARLRRFAVAMLGDDPDELAAARDELAAAVGNARAAQAAGIVAGFDAINRVADATGIALDTRSQAATRALVADLALESMRSDVTVTG